jgi:hypothetical protein
MGWGKAVPTRFLHLEIAPQAHKTREEERASCSRERDAGRARPIVGKSGARSGAEG